MVRLRAVRMSINDNFSEMDHSTILLSRNICLQCSMIPRDHRCRDGAMQCERSDTVQAFSTRYQGTEPESVLISMIINYSYAYCVVQTVPAPLLHAAFVGERRWWWPRVASESIHGGDTCIGVDIGGAAAAVKQWHQWSQSITVSATSTIPRA